MENGIEPGELTRILTKLPDTTYSGFSYDLMGDGAHITDPEQKAAYKLAGMMKPILGRAPMQWIDRPRDFAPQTVVNKVPAALLWLMGAQGIGWLALAAYVVLR